MLNDFKYLPAHPGSATLASKTRVYLDHNATTPLALEVAEKVPLWLSDWGNPSSIHWAGRGPKSLIREARMHLSQGLHCDALELLFTSGGSESNTTVIKGYIAHHLQHHPESSLENIHIISSRLEHPSLVKTLEALEKEGLRVSWLRACSEKGIDLKHYEELLQTSPQLVSVMYANNETGHILPIQTMARMAHAQGALFHSDMVQALGKTPIDLKELDVDYASFSGHKFYALKGVGVLFIRRSRPLAPLLHGGGQERRRRAGTENTLAIASLGLMAQRLTELSGRVTSMGALRRLMEERIVSAISGAVVIGAEAHRLENTSSILLPGVDGETLLMNLDMQGYAVSTGAACSSGNPEPSPVLLALGLTREQAQSSLRVSLGWGTTQDEVTNFVETLQQVTERLRSLNEREVKHALS